MYTFDRAFFQDPSLPYSSISWASDLPIPDIKDTQLAERLLKAYDHTMEFESSLAINNSEKSDNVDLWNAILRDHMNPLWTAIQDRNANDLAKELREFGKNYTWFGGINLGLDGYCHWEPTEEFASHLYWDKLVTFGVSLGILPVEGVENGPSGNWGSNLKENDPTELLSKIESKIGFPIARREVALPTFGLSIDDRLIHYRHINAAYVANRILNLTPKDTETPSIVEIGGGLGLIAEYCLQARPCYYRIYDLPITNLLAGWFLLKSTGEKNIELFGENSPLQHKISILPGTSLLRGDFQNVDMFVNLDSFPEIHREKAIPYLEEMKSSKFGAKFLSINHEHLLPFSEDGHHLRVMDLIDEIGGFQSIARSPYWLRTGYVEELYERTCEASKRTEKTMSILEKIKRYLRS
ncbi:hypothetical protein [Parasedimentitalea maritima]|uniref:Sugar O-methyltransferase n=1 Tax=Parasedimentitalea maritima TaxID=2578117 RepID=A0A6A4RDI6_9RHOB|nr:hypothetical protein [Zongyanglinia marina]KAE9625935.1 hypothetical protein GP644_22025 [Zongyanglinia marina]